MNSNIKVISFDLDGVLYDGFSASYSISKPLGLSHKYDDLFHKMAQEGLSLREGVIEGGKIWTGIPANGTYDDKVDSLPLMEGAVETVASLKSLGYEVGCISIQYTWLKEWCS